MKPMHVFQTPTQQRSRSYVRSGRRWRTLACALAVFLTLLPTVSSTTHADASTQAQGTPDRLIPVGKRAIAPDFTLTDAHGRPITLSAYRGKVVLLDFWATWCGGCKLEIPWYMEFDMKYKQQGLAAIGVSMDAEGWQAVRPFLAQKKDEETGGNTSIQYPVVIGNASLAKQYAVSGLPVTLLIDRHGKIALAHAGLVDKGNFESQIQKLLQQP